MKISFKNNVSSFTQQDIGSPTFLDWLYSIEIIPKETIRRKHRDKSYQLEIGYFVVNPTLNLLFFIRESVQYENIRKTTITVRKTSPLT